MPTPHAHVFCHIRHWLPALGLILALFMPAVAHADATTVTRIALNRPATPCADHFVPYVLDHITTTADGMIRMFEANGSGLAAGDLDNDGDLDLVLGGYEGSDHIFWNETGEQGAGFAFRKAVLSDGYTRMVTLVDVDGDGWLDIVLTRSTGGINYLRNMGAHEEGFQDESDRRNGPIRFRREVLPGVSRPATVINWGDLDADGDLDLVTGSYDAGLLTDLGNSYLLGGGGGIVYYTRTGQTFVRTGLATTAQAMAILLHDLDGDGRSDIVVGNDFAEPDRIWLQREGGWEEATPFAATTHSTMSLDLGDADNDGRPELFASDMKPYAADPATQAAWAPLMAAMADEHHPEGDRQIMENTFQVWTGPAAYANLAASWGVDGTGWSWSAKFGDLDRDGYLDLYVVNGMIEERMFAHLPNHELVEANQAFRNNGQGRFVRAPEWGLGSTYSGRGMVMADFDLDGDLDIAVNNLRAPAQLFENRLCGGRSLQVDLRWPAAQNTHAIGARLALRTSRGVLYRDVRAASGYLSGDPARVHFGVHTGAELGRLDILWPDGARSTVTDLTPDQLIIIEREE
ncbi:MAG TPA: CRTAC1 family protein [Caldilineaceae bacterium]|nr:CRTAC1 family protein [Caldilineaceae bacterium]